jgi:hypothetical protein
MTKRSSIVGILSIVPCEEKTDFGPLRAHQRRGEADRGEHRKAAGAFAEGLDDRDTLAVAAV